MNSEPNKDIHNVIKVYCTAAWGICLKMPCYFYFTLASQLGGQLYQFIRLTEKCLENVHVDHFQIIHCPYKEDPGSRQTEGTWQKRKTQKIQGRTHATLCPPPFPSSVSVSPSPPPPHPRSINAYPCLSLLLNVRRYHDTWCGQATLHIHLSKNIW